MKKIFVMMFALTLGMGAANAQEVTNAETVETTEQATKVSLCKEIYPDAERDGDFYHGLTPVSYTHLTLPTTSRV